MNLKRILKEIKLNRITTKIKSFLLMVEISHNTFDDYLMVGEKCYGLYSDDKCELYLEIKRILKKCELEHNSFNINLTHELVREMIIPKLSNRNDIIITDL